MGTQGRFCRPPARNRRADMARNLLMWPACRNNPFQHRVAEDVASGRASGLAIDDRNRINLDQIVGGKGRDSHHDVGRLVLPEQRHLSFFDDG
jgi:hypothetical protein